VTAVVDPVGLELGSLFFFDLDSDLEVPLTIFDIFCTVLSVIDSVLDSFGDLMLESDPDLTRPSSFLSSLLFTSSLNDPDLDTLVPDDDEDAPDDDWPLLDPSFTRAPWSPDELLLARPSFPVLSDDLSVCLNVARILSVMLCACAAAGGGEMSSCSGPSSGMVG